MLLSLEYISNIVICGVLQGLPKFQGIVASTARKHAHKASIYKLRDFLSQLKAPLRKLNKEKFTDLHEQQARVREQLNKIQQQVLSDPQNTSYIAQEKTCREQYISVLFSSISLIKQQWKIEWVQYGDDCIKYYIARPKGRKLASYIYTIQDDTGATVEGFDAVGNIIMEF